MDAFQVSNGEVDEKERRTLRCMKPKNLLTSPTAIHFGPYVCFMTIGYIVYLHLGGDLVHAPAKTLLGYVSTVAEGLGLLTLRNKVRSRQSVSGVSGASIQMFALTYTIRLYQLWPRIGRDYINACAVEVLSLLSLVLVLDILWCVFWTYRKSYQEDIDILKFTHLVPGCFLAAVLIHPQFPTGSFFSTAWALGFYIDVLALLPQVVMMAQGSGRVLAPISNYVVAVVFSRMIDLEWWLTRGIDLGPQGRIYGWNYSGWIIVGVHLLSLVLAADFVYYYLKAKWKGSALQDDLVLPTCQDAPQRASKKDLIIGAASATGRWTSASLAPTVPYLIFLLVVYIVYAALGGDAWNLAMHWVVAYVSAVAEGLGLVFLRAKISRLQSVRGISGTSIKMFAVTYTIRLWQLWPRSTKYLLDSCMVEVLSLASLLMVLEICKCVFWDYRTSYQRDFDVLKTRHLVPGCMVFALLLHPSFRKGSLFSILWTFGFYLDVASLLPQVAMMASGCGRIEAPISNYVAAITLSRTTDLVWWFERGTDLGPQGWMYGFNYSGAIIVGVHVLALVLAGDFSYYYLKAKFNGSKFDDDLVLPLGDIEAAAASKKEGNVDKCCTA